MEFVFKAIHSSKFPCLISSLKAQSCLRKGSHGFLASVSTISEETKPQLNEVEVVCEFPGFFPDEKSGLPPNRELEFFIELVPNETPVSKAPYRLALTEMKELKDKIQDLLGKGFIRPSFSPWGAPSRRKMEV